MSFHKTILVTGGNRGLGLEICRQLATMKHRVILTGRTEEKVQTAKEKLAKAGLEVSIEVLDVNQPERFEAFAKKIRDKYENLDVLINNAGVFIKETDYFHTVDRPTLETTFHTNLFGPVLLSQQIIPLLQKSKEGRIINVSSYLGALSDMNRNHTSYRLSKAALNAFTLHLSAEYPLLKVNACHPGHVQTDMGGAHAQRSVEKGAETPVWLATTPEVLSGKFYFDKHVIDW